VAAGNEMRVSDAEREAAAAGLREHFASGRLDADELDQRLSAAFAARTRGDLSVLFTDLPPGGQAGQDDQGRRDAGHPFGPGQFGPGPFGPRPFGGPFGGGPFRPGQFGPRAGWDQGQPGDEAGWQPRGNAGRASAGRSFGQVAAASVVLWVLFIVGILGVFGIGTGRPLGIVLLIAAFALLRRLVFSIFGRRRAGGGRSRRRR
jgi:Domain of unknown function (DUF1707)